LVSKVIFLITLGVVLITLTSVIFPALIMEFTNEIKYPVDINPFELGIWAIPVLTINLLLLVLIILYQKKLFPDTITKFSRFIFHFEVSAKTATLVIMILIGIYISFSIDELSQRDPWEDFGRIKPTLENWSYQDIANVDDHSMVYLLSKISMDVFGNYRIVPFIASIALLILTYFITTEISQKRFAGIVSVIIVLQSGNFLTYDTTITYPNFWILFYLLSLYTIYKRGIFSPITYALSTISKPFTVFFIPMSLFFIFRANIERNKKIRIIIYYGIVVILGASLLLIIDYSFISIKFDSHEFVSGFTTISSQFRFDGLILVFLLPLTVGLYITSTKGIKQADSILVLILGMLLLAPIISGFTTYTNGPYRFIPLVIFFAIGVGTLLSKSEITIKKKMSRIVREKE